VRQTHDGETSTRTPDEESVTSVLQKCSEADETRL